MFLNYKSKILKICTLTACRAHNPLFAFPKLCCSLFCHVKTALAAYKMATLENHFLVKNLLLTYWAWFIVNIRNGLPCSRK
uniref:Uncharacterized protein n=1 Tax=Arundo donax TaxID=35708 RepID=A0A0A9E2U8_ARUDO